MQPCNHLLICSKRHSKGNQKVYVSILTVKTQTNKKPMQNHIHINPQMQLQHCKKMLDFADSLIAGTKVRNSMTTTSKQGKVM